MPAFVKANPDEKRHSRFILLFVAELARLSRRYPHYLNARSKSLKVSEPSLMLGKKSMCFGFDLKGTGASYYSTEGDTSHAVTAQLDTNVFEAVDSQSINQSRTSGKFEIKLKCKCRHNTSMGVCEHSIAVHNYLVSKLKNHSSQSVMQLLESWLVDSQKIGEQLVQELNQAAQKLAAPEQYRLQWRVLPEDSYDSPDETGILCYMQKMKAKGGGWTSGRKISDPIQAAPSSAFQSADDFLVASLLEADEYAEPGDRRGWVRALELLKDRPDFVWDTEPQVPVRVKRCQPTIEFEEEGGLFSPVLKLDGEPFTNFASLKNFDGGYLVIRNFSDQTIRYFELTTDQVNYLRVINRATRRGARLNSQSTLALTKVISQTDLSNGLIALIPDVLCGPEVPLPPKIELHLVPRSGGGLEARLRVACEGLETPPTPGMGSDRIPAFTPAGACMFVRDLVSEAANADRFANQLAMGEFQFDGPYAWLTNSLEQSLQMLAKCREVGEDGPTVCWPASKPMRLLGEITPQCLKVRLTSQRDWFGLEGELCMDDMQVPLAELFAALRSGARFVPLGDGGFATISDDLRQRLSIMDDVALPERTGLSVSRAAAGMIKDAIGQDIPAEIDQRWHDAIERLNDKTKVPKKPPKQLQAEFRDYQMAGYQWLSQLSNWGLGGCLADDMGLGKTVQALGVLLDRQSSGPALIVAPTSVGGNWMRETEKFAPSLKPHLYREHDRDELLQNATAGDLIIASYQMVQRDAERFCGRQWGTLVLDEAQFIKNFHTKTCATIRQIEAEWSLALTGTPLENHLGELWSLMRVISPGLLGSWERFRERFAEPIERGKDHQRLLSLGRVLRPFMLRRTKSEVLTELPPRTEIVHTIELSGEERKRYDAARLAALAELAAKDQGENDQQKRIRVLSWLTRLRQLACHPRLVDPRWKKSSAKLDGLIDIVTELVSSKHRALVFSQFVQHLTIVREAMDKAGVKYQYLDGSTPPAKRQAAVDAFQQGEGSLFLISLKAGGTGLNLTGADYVLHLDPWWNPAVEDQATDRAHRIGQTEKVTVFRLVAKDTIEEQILALHASKRELIAGVLDGTDRAAKLSTQDLVNLIRLGLTTE